MSAAELTAWISNLIADQVANSPENSLRNQAGEKAFTEVLVGFAAGDDPLFAEYKRHIGEFFWRPEEAFALAYPGDPAPAGELSVISWILPQPAYTRAENAAENIYCSERWARCRLYGEQFNAWLRGEVVRSLGEAGHPALAPMLLPQWRMQESVDYSYASTWSERHAAYAAGLGTFGLCDGLITAKGKAMRTGSVIVRARLTPSRRPYTGIHDYCLFYSQGTCGKCIPRCPMNALSDQGHDKIKCSRHTRGSGKEHNQEQFGLSIEGCGLCQVGVPCEDHIPAPAEGL
ncbi:MAG: hypothetical protein V1797_03120 [Pseudomonadota bacterium]